MQLISSSLYDNCSNSARFRKSFSEIEFMVDKKLQDVTNPSFSAPSLAPVQTSLCQGHSDPSLPSPRPGVRHSGEVVEEPEQDQQADYPFVVHELVDFANSQGVSFS